MADDISDVSKWWRTSIINMSPGVIEFRGTPIQELMGNLSYSEMILFMVLGEKLSPEKQALFEVAMVMSVDHGPQSPSIAISRMASTCGIGINNVIASAVNVLGDHHGGAGEQCAQLLYDINHIIKEGLSLTDAVAKGISLYREKYGKTIPGFGHRFHNPIDPRSPRAMELVKESAQNSHIEGIFREIALEIENQISKGRHKNIPMNVDGASAVIFCELGIPTTVARGLFCLSRSVGILAHAWEQMGKHEKNKGPVPKNYLPLYEGSQNDNR